MKRDYEQMMKELPLEACSRDLVPKIIAHTGIKGRVQPAPRALETGKADWGYRLATLLVILFLTGTAMADLQKPAPVDQGQWSINSINLVQGVARNATAVVLINEGKVDK